VPKAQVANIGAELPFVGFRLNPKSLRMQTMRKAFNVAEARGWACHFRVYS